MADYTLTVYQADDATPLFEVGTAPTHPHPYLQILSAFGEAEIDLQQGKALIGQINVGVIDPKTGATQSDRFLTALLATASGHTALNGARALLQQVSPAAVVQDGVCFGVTLSDDYSSFSFQLRDIRERGRKVGVFQRTGTATVLPRGVLNGYGKLPNGEWLLPPTTPLTGTYSGDAASGSIALDGAPAKPGDEVPAELIVTDKMRSAMRSVPRPGSLSFVWPDEIFDQVSVLWRPVGGSTWTELRDISAPVVNQLPYLGPVFVGGLVPAETGIVKNADGTTTAVVGAKAIQVDSSAGGTLPTDGQRVEVVILYTGPASDDYPLHFEGAWGEFARNLLRGDYCGDDEAGNPIDPRLRYDEAAILAVDTPVRIRITEPRDDLRSVLEELCAGIGGAPALDAAGKISPVVYHLPDVDAVLPEINDGNAEAIPGWDHPADTAITVVEAKYARDFVVPDEQDPNGERSAGDGLSTREITIRRAPEDLIASMGEQVLSLDLWMFRALGGINGQPISGDTRDERASQIAVERQHQALDRFGYGGVSSSVRLRASAFPGLRVGDWVLDARSWRPNYATGKRGGNALAQVVSLRQLNPEFYEARLIDAGPEDQPLDQPTLGTPTVAADGTLSVPVTGVPAGGEARVDYAISATLPATDSPLWTFLPPRTATAQTLKSPPLPAGVTVWVRARSEGIGRRRSAWTNAVTATAPSTPRVLSASVAVAEDGTPTVSWSVNAAAAGMRLYYAAHDPAVVPTLSTYLDADAAAGTAAPPITVQPGAQITVEFEPYPTWTGTAVSGTPGERVRRTAVRPAAVQQFDAQYASDDAGSNASSTFDPAIHTYARWSKDGGVTWTDWFKIVGEDGASSEGRYVDFIFKTATSQPATPTGTAPTGWFDAPPAYDPATTKLWFSQATRDGIDDSLLSTWSVPVQLTGAQGPQGPTGPQGPQGIQGPAGADGEANYFHIAYADSPDGVTNFNQTAGIYVGTYVDGDPTDSANPAAYNWQRFQGAQGADGTDGIPGVDGADGQTSYLHIAYADTATGGGFSQSPTGKAYIGTYVDFVQTDSSDPAAYTWAKIQGPVGPQGPQGDPGPAGSSDPTASISQPYVADGADVGATAQVTYFGALGTGGVGPLQWRTRYGTSWSAWSTAALPVIANVDRHPKNARLLELEVKDDAGVVASASTMIAPRLSVVSATGSVPFSNISDDTTYRKPGAAYVDASGRVASVYRTGIVEPATNLFKRNSDTLDSVVDSPTYRRTTHAEADQATAPSQNLMGQQGTAQYTNTAAGDAYVVILSVLLSDAGLQAGDVVSASADLASQTGADGMLLQFYAYNAASGGSLVSGGDASSPTVYGNYPNWARAKAEGMTIPAGTVRLDLLARHTGNTEAAYARRFMLNRGPIALPYEAPPLRSGRESQDDLGDGTSFRRIGSGYSDGSNRLINVYRAGAVESAGNLFKRGSDTLDDVVQGTARRWVDNNIADSAGRAVNVYRGGYEPVVNLFKIASNTLDQIAEGSTYRRIASAFSDASNRLINVFRSGVTESTANLFKKSVDTLDAVADSATYVRTTPTQRTGADRAAVALDTNNRLTDQRRLNQVVSANIGCLQRNLSITATWDSTAGVGGSWKITVSAHTVVYGFGSVSYNQGVAWSAPSSTAYLYYNDPDFAGGSLSLVATGAPQNLIGDGKYRVGEIVLPAEGSTPDPGTPGGSGAHPIVGA